MEEKQLASAAGQWASSDYQILLPSIKGGESSAPSGGFLSFFLSFFFSAPDSVGFPFLPVRVLRSIESGRAVPAPIQSPPCWWTLEIFVTNFISCSSASPPSAVLPSSRWPQLQRCFQSVAAAPAHHSLGLGTAHQTNQEPGRQ